MVVHIRISGVGNSYHGAGKAIRPFADAQAQSSDLASTSNPYHYDCPGRVGSLFRDRPPAPVRNSGDNRI